VTNHHYHAVVWIDHHQARVFHFNPEDIERLVIKPDHPTRQIHHKANTIGSGHASEDHQFLEEVAEALSDAGAILIVGPANEKAELVKHIEKHRPKLAAVVVGVETVDHPSDPQVVAHARKYFKATDRMQRQIG